MSALIRSLSRGNLRSPQTLSPVSSSDNSCDYENDSFLADKPSTEELREILSDPQRTAAFKRFLDTEFCTEALLFWVDAENYRKSDNILYDTKTEAKAIYDKYLTLESEQQINIDGTVVELIRKLIKSVDILRRITEKISAPDRNIFIEAQEYIFDLLRTDSFRKFRKSSVFNATEIHGDISIENSPGRTNRKFQELNTTTIYDGADIKCDVWYLSATLLNMLLKLFKKHTFNLKSLYIENQKVRELFNIISDLDYNRFVTATSQLQKVRLINMTHKEKLVFFLNIYNTLSLHALLEFDAPLSYHQKINFSKKAMYKIGNEKYSLMDIEHSILRASMSRPSVLGLRLGISKMSKGDPRLQHALTSPEPLLNFVLYNLTKESPLVTVYTPEMVGVKMALLTTEYLEREIEKSGFDGYGAKPLIKLPKLVSWYINDFAASGKDRDMMNYLITYFPEELKTRVKFFGGNVKIRFKDANWNGIGGYMGSSFYDPQLAENEIKKEHIGSLKVQLNDLEKLFDDATRREDKNQMNKLKPQIEDLNKRLEIVL